MGKNNKLWCENHNLYDKHLPFLMLSLRSIVVLYDKNAKQRVFSSFSPERVPTRWVNDLDIGFFLLKFIFI